MKTMKLYETKEKCCGCWGCFNVCPQNAITMRMDNEGFYYPVIDEKICIDCKMCLQVCPVTTATNRKEIQKNIPRIGIINLSFTNNYGASIAASVLENVVRDIVGDRFIVETINYQGQVNGGLIKKYRDQINDAGGYFKYKKRKKHYYDLSDNVQMRSERSKRFLFYNDSFLNLTPLIGDAAEINNDKNYLAFIAGSDVIWQPKRTRDFRSDGYYLKFADKSQRTIAYAPSIDHICDKSLYKLSPLYKERISGLDYISVREKTSVEFLQELTDKKVYNCCDPIFLVNEDYYLPIINSVNTENEKYVYVYVLEKEQMIVDYARKIATDKGIKIYYYCPNVIDFGVDAEYCLADGPCEFLNRIYNADYVLTNSFHCVAFSLLFKKKFLSFRRNDSSIKSNDLLSLFDLENRLILSNQDFNIDIDDEIDFEKTSVTIDKIRKESYKYLQMVLFDL